MSIGGSQVGNLSKQSDFYGEAAKEIVQPVVEELATLGRDYGVSDETIRGIFGLVSEAIETADRSSYRVTPQDVLRAISRGFEPPTGSN